MSAALTDDELLAALGPGCGDAPVFAWNAFAFALGRRLLQVIANEGDVQPQFIEIAATALAAVGGAEQILADERACVNMAMIEATLRPLATMTGSPAADLLQRVFLWGTRRVRRDRMRPDALADLAAAARDVHAELAELAGHDPAAARAAEGVHPLADARAVLAGDAGRLLE
jgi:hypothetical protein